MITNVTEEQADCMRSRLREVREEYRNLFVRLEKHEISHKEFLKLERALDREGRTLRESLGIGAKSLGGVFCYECGKTFETGLKCRSTFERCRMHHNCKEYKS